MYTLVEEAGVYHHNLRTHQRLFEVLLEAGRARRLAVKCKEVALGRQYQDLYDQWRTHLTGDYLHLFQVNVSNAKQPPATSLWLQGVR